jgi:hypothetical protein
MTYEKARAEYDAISAKCDKASKVLNGFPRGPFGLTPDSVKRSPEFQAACREFDFAFAAQRAFASVFTKTYTAEIRAERNARYVARVEPL